MVHHPFHYSGPPLFKLHLILGYLLLILNNMVKTLVLLNPNVVRITIFPCQRFYLFSQHWPRSRTGIVYHQYVVNVVFAECFSLVCCIAQYGPIRSSSKLIYGYLFAVLFCLSHHTLVFHITKLLKLRVSRCHFSRSVPASSA